CTGDERECPAIDPAEVEVGGRPREGDIHRGLQLGGDLQVLSDLIGGAARDDGEWYLVADDPRGRLGEGTIASDDADRTVAAFGGGPREVGCVPRAPGLDEVEVRAPGGEGTADQPAQPGRGLLTGGRVEDDEDA